MSLLTLSQSQALAAHPDRIDRRTGEGPAGQGRRPARPGSREGHPGVPPIVLKGGDASRGKEVFKQECAKCHTHSGEGGKVGPDLTGMAAHPKSELIVHILDPSRSVEGNFLQYTVSTTRRPRPNGLLAGETKTSIELLDAEGKKQTILRDDIDELASSKKSLMPEGFEKSIPAEGLADLLQFLAQKGKYLPLDLRKVATVDDDEGAGLRDRAGHLAPGVRGLGPEGRQWRAIRPGRSAGRPRPERRHAAKRARDDPAQDAEGGEPARQRDGQGDPPPQWSVDLRVPRRTRGVHFDDRPHHL